MSHSPPQSRMRLAAKVTAAFSLAVGGAALAVGVSPASAAPLDASAFGLSARVSVAGAAAVDVPPTPAVDCPPDMSEEVVDLSVPGVATADAVTAECSTTDGVVSSMATIANANIADLVTAEAVSAQCTANGEPEGSSVIANLVVNGGEPITVEADSNTEIVNIPGVGTVTLNRQTITENDDGTTTITVDAVVVDLDVAATELPLPGLPPLPATTVDAVLASVSCTSSAAVVEPTVPEPTVPEPRVTEPPTTEPPTTEAPGPIDEAPPAEPIPDDADFTG